MESLKAMPPLRTPESFPPAGHVNPDTIPPPSPRTAPAMTPDAPSFSQPFRAFREAWMGYGERAFLRALLDRHESNVASAAKEAGIDRTHMYRLIRKHGL
jgi:transcriptional regulator of acetoin/glycerol metabolism